ncbi:MAG TPA: YetF domain-containing protein [Pseudolabrys sp.]|nr:YetF domain-containing protein [Pseudolabrys sp.]
MLDMAFGFGEHILRAFVVYIFLFLALRFIGKKHIGELAPFDLVVLLILSETVQNSMIGGDQSLIGGLVSAATLIALAQAFGYLSWRSKRFERFVEGTPKILVRHGQRCRDVMQEQHISISELTEAMRREGCSNIADVRIAILENDGSISVIKRAGTVS